MYDVISNIKLRYNDYNVDVFSVTADFVYTSIYHAMSCKTEISQCMNPLIIVKRTTVIVN